MTFAVAADATHWSAKVAVPALGENHVTVGLDRQPLPWPSWWHTTLSCDAWGDCPLVLRRKGDDLLGQIKIHGTTYDLELRRVPPSAPARPAERWEPKRPITYGAEPVTFRSGTIHIAGELTVPAGEGPHPAVLLLAGGEAADRNGNAFIGQEKELYPSIADYLARRGFAVLRTDDRGVGGSTGGRDAATLAELADDAVAAVAYLAARPEVRRNRVGLIGYSEGAIVAPTVCAKIPCAVSYVVLLAPQAVVGAVGNMEQLKRRAARLCEESEGASVPADVKEELRKWWEERLALDRWVFGLLFSGVEPTEIRQQLVSMNRFPGWQIDVALQQVSSDRGVYAMRHNPGPVLSKVDVPALAVYFGKDEIIPPDLNEPVLRAAIARGGNRDFTVKVFPDYGHSMRHPAPEQGHPQPARPRVPERDVLEFVSGWLKDRMGGSYGSGRTEGDTPALSQRSSQRMSPLRRRP